MLYRSAVSLLQGQGHLSAGCSPSASPCTSFSGISTLTQTGLCTTPHKHHLPSLSFPVKLNYLASATTFSHETAPFAQPENHARWRVSQHTAVTQESGRRLWRQWLTLSSSVSYSRTRVSLARLTLRALADQISFCRNEEGQAFFPRPSTKGQRPSSVNDWENGVSLDTRPATVYARKQQIKHCWNYDFILRVTSVVPTDCSNDTCSTSSVHSHYEKCS